jgi:hypothetical protein
MEWISSDKPAAPVVERVNRKGESIVFKIRSPEKNSVSIKYYVLYRFPAGRSIGTLIEQPSFIYSLVVKPVGFEQMVPQRENGVTYQYYVSAVGINNMESEPVPVTTVVKD